MATGIPSEHSSLSLISKNASPEPSWHYCDVIKQLEHARAPAVSPCIGGSSSLLTFGMDADDGADARARAGLLCAPSQRAHNRALNVRRGSVWF